MEHTIYPEKHVYIYYQFLKSVFWTVGIISVLVTAVSFIARLNELSTFVNMTLVSGVVGVIAILFLAFRFVSLLVSYKKTSWRIEETKLIWKRGGLFSDSESEVPIVNVTYLGLKKPWLEHRFFGTGTIIVDSAGTSGISIMMSTVFNSDTIYEQIKLAMKKNGFSLNQKKILESSKPNVWIYLLKMIAYGFFLVIFFGVQFVPAIISIVTLGFMYTVLLFSIGFVLVLFFAFKLILSYLDVKHTEYRVYDDCVEYNNGFLTTHDAIIPAENITDTILKQDFLEHILGVHNLSISCQGASREIAFTHIYHGESMKQAIDDLNDRFDVIKTKKDEASLRGTSVKSQKSAQSVDRSSVKRLIKRDKEFTASFKMNMKSALMGPLFNILVVVVPLAVLGLLVLAILFIAMPGLFVEGKLELLTVFLVGGASLVFPLMFGLGAAFIGVLINASVTDYELKPTSLKLTRTFLSKDEFEFSADRVTSVVVKESFFQKLLGTCSIDVFSIGSSTTLSYLHVSKEYVPQICEKVGLQKEAALSSKAPKWSIGLFVFKSLPAILGLFAIAVAVTILASNLLLGVIGFATFGILTTCILLLKSYLYVTYTSLETHKSFLLFKTGWLFKTQTFVHANNVRDVTSTQFPFSKRGKVALEVAGASSSFSDTSTQQNTSGQKIIVSNRIRMHYVCDVQAYHAELDEYLLGSARSTKVLFESKPNILPAVISRTIFSVIIFPLLVIYPLTLLEIIVRMKNISFKCDETRIHAYTGIIFKMHKTMLISNVDHVHKSQGPIQKITKVGSVYIATTGTESFDMALFDLADYMALYDLLKK